MDTSVLSLLLRMNTPERARDIVEGILGGAGHPRLVDIIRQEFLGSPDEPPALLPGVGGAATIDPIDPSELDPRIFKLMELTDSIHDCRSFKHRELILRSLDVVFPMIQRRPGGPLVKMGLEDVASWERFHDIMTRHPTFKFPGDKEPVRNPLFDRSFVDTQAFQYADGSTITSEFEKYLQTSKLDVFCFRDAGAHVYELAQIARVCGAVRSKFGGDPVRGNDVTFMPDAGDFVVRIVLGLTVAYDVLKARFDVLVQEADRDVVARELRASRGVYARFTCRASDASMMDSADHPYAVHTAETGPVFHEKSAAQVELFGGSPFMRGGQIEDTYDFEVTSTVAIPERSAPDDTSFRKTVTSETDGVGEYRKEWMWNGNLVDHSKAKMNTDLTTLHDLKGATPRERNCAVVVALKRAGDWGMVQHCRKYGMVFVTTDRFAALYAAYRGVCVMFLKVNEVRMPAWDTSMRRDDPRQPKAKTEFDQYTFSLFATDAGRSALRFYEDDVPQDVFRG